MFVYLKHVYMWNMYVYLKYVCMYVCTYVCMHACMYVCTYVCMHVCMYVMYVCNVYPKYVCISQICMYMQNMYVYLSIYMYVCMFLFIWLYTYWGINTPTFTFFGNRYPMGFDLERGGCELSYRSSEDEGYILCDSCFQKMNQPMTCVDLICMTWRIEPQWWVDFMVQWGWLCAEMLEKNKDTTTPP